MKKVLLVGALWLSVQCATSAQMDSMLMYSFNYSGERAVQSFKPFDLPGQKPVVYSASTEFWANVRRSIPTVVFYASLIFITALLFKHIRHSVFRIILLLGSLAVGVAGGYVLAMFYALSFSRPVWEDRAMLRLHDLALYWQMKPQNIAPFMDEKAELGMATGPDALIIVDYKDNQGWYIPKEKVTFAAAQPDESIEVAQDAIHIKRPIVAGGYLPQHFVIGLKDTSPSQIHLYYQTGASSCWAESMASSIHSYWYNAELE